jgi:2-keto-4-pentenoate hydratase/2-oxohepta-3-ene-1,7-dioic acid hydratase in catechol pathway
MRSGPGAAADITRYVRFDDAGTVGYGILADDGATIRLLASDFLGPDGPTGAAETGATLARADVRLLPPTYPRNVIARGFNYASHISSPRDGDVPEAGAGAYMFRVTAGNDVSERGWQGRDLQWLRAKASDTFGLVGPAVVTGLDWNDLLVETRVDGEPRQAERTTHLIDGVAKIVAYVSRYVTMQPGDLIFTGTPGRTRALSPGETVSVTVEGVGTLTSPVVLQVAAGAATP